MAFIRFNGSPARTEDIRAAINALKPASEILAVPTDDGVRFDQVWPGGGQVSEDRWRIRDGQWFDASTGAVHDELPE